MTWLEDLQQRLHCPGTFPRLKQALVAAAPWPMLLLLFQAMPSPRPGQLPAPWSALAGFLVGLSFPMLWLLGIGVMEAGWRGWLRAFAMGLSLAEFLTGTEDALRGFRAGWKGVSDPAPLAATWASFSTYLLVSLALMVLIRRLAHHRAEAERQKHAADDARQQVLRARLAPHFIFNTLNTLHAQIEADPRGAQTTTERLAALFRQVVAVADQPTIPLKQELAFVEAYLGIEQARLGDRLRVEITIPEELESAHLPPLSLQVLVENAIKHGVTPLERGGTVRIGAVRDLLSLKVWVEDPGPGLSTQRGTGTALDTLRQRLDRPEDLTMGMEDGRHRVSFRWRQA